jgi:hypothetical protein
MAQEYEETARLRLMAMNVKRAGMEVKAPKGHNNSLDALSTVTTGRGGRSNWLS